MTETVYVTGKREISRTFSQNLKHYRLLKNLTLKQLSEMSCVDSGYLNKLETGKRKAPSYPIIVNIAKALSIKVSDLIDIESVEREVPIKSVQEVLIYNEFLIKGKLPTMKTRENFVELVQLLLDSEWEEHSKHTDAVKIFNQIDIFLNAIK